jgi:hypothetical protein
MYQESNGLQQCNIRTVLAFVTSVVSRRRTFGKSKSASSDLVVLRVDRIRSAGQHVAVLLHPSEIQIERHHHAVFAQFQVAHARVALVAERHVFPAALQPHAVAHFSGNQRGAVVRGDRLIGVQYDGAALYLERERDVRDVTCRSQSNRSGADEPAMHTPVQESACDKRERHQTARVAGR